MELQPFPFQIRLKIADGRWKFIASSLNQGRGECQLRQVEPRFTDHQLPPVLFAKRYFRCQIFGGIRAAHSAQMNILNHGRGWLACLRFPHRNAVSFAARQTDSSTEERKEDSFHESVSGNKFADKTVGRSCGG